METSKEQPERGVNNFQKKASRQIPSFYVDAAEVHSLPFTLQIILGSQTASGEPEPRLHLSMNPHFAAYLRNALDEALDVYQSDSDRRQNSTDSE